MGIGKFQPPTKSIPLNRSTKKSSQLITSVRGPPIPNLVEIHSLGASGQMGEISLTHSLTAALDQLRVVASSTSNDPGPRSRQHQQIGQCLIPLAAANFSVDDKAGASSQQREECRCGLLLTVAVPAKQVCSPVGDRCDQI